LVQPLRAATACEVDLVRKRPDHGNAQTLDTETGNSDRSFTYARLNRPLTRTSPCEDWSLTSLKEKLIKIGAKVVSSGRYVAFQMAEVAISRHLFYSLTSCGSSRNCDRHLIPRRRKAPVVVRSSKN
jgi:hypothetical protein